jgi:putative DNA primase/helicase
VLDFLDQLEVALEETGCDPHTVHAGVIEARCPLHPAGEDVRLVLLPDGGELRLRCDGACDEDAILDELGVSRPAEAVVGHNSVDHNSAIPSKRKRRSKDRSQVGVSLIGLADVEERPINWLWPGYIALGRCHLNDGDPGVNKTTVEFDLGARVTRGAAWPDGTPNRQGAGVVVVLSAEDNPEDTIKPRFKAAGADITRVFFVSPTFRDEGGMRLLAVPGDVERIRAAVAEAKSRCAASYAFIVVDPIVAYLGNDTDSFKDQDVRRAMTAIAELCDEMNSAASCIRHFTKATASKMIHQGGGSIAFTGAARVAWATVFDPTDEEHKETPNEQRRLIVPFKNNLGKVPPSLQFRVHSHTYVSAYGQIETVRVEWLGTSPVTYRTLEDLAEKDKTSRRMSKEAVAALWVQAILTQGPMRQTDVERHALSAGIRLRTLQRASKEPRVYKKRVGSAKGGTQEWWWALSPTQLERVTDDDQLLPVGDLKNREAQQTPMSYEVGYLKEEQAPDQGEQYGIEIANTTGKPSEDDSVPFEMANPDERGGTKIDWDRFLRLSRLVLPLVSVNGLTCDIHAWNSFPDAQPDMSEEALWEELHIGMGAAI